MLPTGDYRMDKSVRNIQMVDLISQYQKIKEEVDQKILEVVGSSRYIKGPYVETFEKNLAEYLGVKHVIGCANGTDALQVAMMALGLRPGDEVIVPGFTYVATAEVIALLGLTPIMVDVDPNTFNIDIRAMEQAITAQTRAIVPVHLFGQTARMDEILTCADKYGLYVIEDNAQAIGADFYSEIGLSGKTGTLGHVGCTSFFPSKNLGCYGDGGAMFTNDDEIAAKLKMVANHGQSRRYYHDVVGVNSRLDAIQAAVLDIKLRYLDQYSEARRNAATIYDKGFKDVAQLETPFRAKHSTHVFHQYVMKVKNGKRDELVNYLKEKGIPAMIYYPVPLDEQQAFRPYADRNSSMPVTKKLCEEVIALPMHTELDSDIQSYIISEVINFFNS